MPKLQIYVEVTYGHGIVFAAEDTEAVAGILSRASFAESEYDSPTCREQAPVRVIRLLAVQKEAEKPVQPPAAEAEGMALF